MLIPQPNSERLSSARVLTDKYAWMLRWALQFTQNDQAMAEDLVQETYLRISRSYPFLDDVQNVDALLYVSLKNAYLGELRRARRHVFEDLKAIEYDSAMQGLRDARHSDTTDMQNELRRVTAYLCWRNQVTKPPSILILRFFHECLPAEIAYIAQVSRKAVSLALVRARQELHSYLVQAPGTPALPQITAPIALPRRESVSSAELLDELFTAIYQSKRTACLMREQLLRRYSEPLVRPIGCDLLAHIVCCRNCLQIIRSHAGGSSSTLERIDPPKRGLKLRSISQDGMSNRAKHCVNSLERRLLTIYEHEPRALVVLANSKVLATRDVNSDICTLKMEAKSESPLEMIEIMSEQGFSLLSVFIEAQPPSAPPNIRRRVEFSLGRSLEIVLRFTAEDPIVEVTYTNPSFLLVTNPSVLRQLEAELEDFSQTVVDFPHDSDPVSEKLRVFPAIKHFASLVFHLAGLKLRRPALGILIACAMTPVLATLAVVWLTRPAVPTQQDLLLNVQRAEQATATETGIVTQQVRIKTGTAVLDRTLHRDVRGLRIPKRPKQTDAATLSLQYKLATAGIGWDEPLAGASYKDWHDHEQVEKDRIAKIGKDLLSLTTDVSDGLVAEESLTVRTSDFHAIGRTVRFRDNSTVEIAELTYEVLPWSPAGEEWFEPFGSNEGSSRSIRPRIQPGFALPRLVTDGELDEAELSARLALARIHADNGEQIEISRRSDAVVVTGIVETTAQEAEITSALHQLSHVVSSIQTLEELSRNPPSGGETETVKAFDSGPAPSPLEAQLLASGWDHDRIGALIRRLFLSAVAVKRDGNVLAVLTLKYPSPANLTVIARVSREALMTHYKANLIEDIAEEQSAIASSGLLGQGAHASAYTDDPSSGSLAETAQHNLNLYYELMSSDGPSQRKPETILAEMGRISNQLEVEAASLDSSDSPTGSISSTHVPKH